MVVMMMTEDTLTMMRCICLCLDNFRVVNSMAFSFSDFMFSIYYLNGLRQKYPDRPIHRQTIEQTDKQTNYRCRQNFCSTCGINQQGHSIHNERHNSQTTTTATTTTKTDYVQTTYKNTTTQWSNREEIFAKKIKNNNKNSTHHFGRTKRKPGEGPVKTQRKNRRKPTTEAIHEVIIIITARTMIF